MEWNIPTSIDAKVFQAAESVAQNGHIRLWQNQVNNSNKNSNQQNQANNSPKSVTGRVVEVNSLGTITVRVQDNQHTHDQKFHFSSIRVPRLPQREFTPETKGKQQKNQRGEVGWEPCRSVSQGVECYSCLPKTAWPPTC